MTYVGEGLLVSVEIKTSLDKTQYRINLLPILAVDFNSFLSLLSRVHQTQIIMNKWVHEVVIMCISGGAIYIICTCRVQVFCSCSKLSANTMVYLYPKYLILSPHVCSLGKGTL